MAIVGNMNGMHSSNTSALVDINTVLYHYSKQKQKRQRIIITIIDAEKYENEKNIYIKSFIEHHVTAFE